MSWSSPPTHSSKSCFQNIQKWTLPPLRGQGVLHENFSGINFLLVSDKGVWYLSDAFGPMKNIVPSPSYCWSKVSAYVYKLHSVRDFQSLALNIDLRNLAPPTFLSNRPQTFRICFWRHVFFGILIKAFSNFAVLEIFGLHFEKN